MSPTDKAGNKLPDAPPPLTPDYVVYLAKRIKAGHISLDTAISGARARKPSLSRKEAKELIERVGR